MKVMLIVEDAPNLLRWLRDSIRRSLPGFELLTATNGAEALELVHQHGPEIIVLDLALPPDPAGGAADVNVGLGLLDSVSSMQPRPRVLVLSSFDLRDEVVRRGADGFVSKHTTQMWPELRERILQAQGS